MAIENSGHFEDFRRPKFSYSHLFCSTSMHLSKSSIKPSGANIVLGKPKICQVFLEFGSQANERVYMCLNHDFYAEDVY